jgi:hypothetical protein
VTREDGVIGLDWQFQADQRTILVLLGQTSKRLLGDSGGQAHELDGPKPAQVEPIHCRTIRLWSIRIAAESWHLRRCVVQRLPDANDTPTSVSKNGTLRSQAAARAPRAHADVTAERISRTRPSTQSI